MIKNVNLIDGRKKCSRCRKLKPLFEFHIDKSRPDGRCYVCKMCASNIRRERYVRIERRQLPDISRCRQNNIRKNREYIRDMMPGYIRSLISKQFGIDVGIISDELVTAKRAQLALKREMRAKNRIFSTLKR
jgi:hypothetical protein